MWMIKHEGEYLGAHYLEPWSTDLGFAKRFASKQEAEKMAQEIEKKMGGKAMVILDPYSFDPQMLEDD